MYLTSSLWRMDSKLLVCNAELLLPFLFFLEACPQWLIRHNNSVTVSSVSSCPKSLKCTKCPDSLIGLIFPKLCILPLLSPRAQLNDVLKIRFARKENKNKPVFFADAVWMVALHWGAATGGDNVKMKGNRIRAHVSLSPSFLSFVGTKEGSLPFSIICCHNTDRPALQNYLQSDTECVPSSGRWQNWRSSYMQLKKKWFWGAFQNIKGFWVLAPNSGLEDTWNRSDNFSIVLTNGMCSVKPSPSFPGRISGTGTALINR